MEEYKDFFFVAATHEKTNKSKDTAKLVAHSLFGLKMFSIFKYDNVASVLNVVSIKGKMFLNLLWKRIKVLFRGTYCTATVVMSCTPLKRLSSYRSKKSIRYSPAWNAKYLDAEACAKRGEATTCNGMAMPLIVCSCYRDEKAAQNYALLYCFGDATVETYLSNVLVFSCP